MAVEIDLRSNFIRVAKDWEVYGEQKVSKSGAEIKVIDTQDPLYKTITATLPSGLSSLNDKKSYKEDLVSKGSPGEGVKTLAPWIATFDTNITVSAKREFYPVYLFSGDLVNLYLSIAFGVTDFEEIFGAGKKSLSAIRNAAATKRIHSEALLEQNLNKRILSELKRSPIDVARGNKNFLHRAYGDGTIFALEYKLKDLPSNEILSEDYDQILDLYKSMVMDISSPDVEELAVAEAIKEKKQELTIKDFEIREPKEPSKKSSSGTSGDKRRSKKSNIVGNEAEELVFKYEQKKLLDLGLTDKEVIWCAKNPADRKPGYDVLSFNEEGEEIYIEVKGTEGKKITSVNLTANEWRVANLTSHKGNYFIYLVYEALTKPKIEVIVNPASMVEDGKLEIKVSDYDLRLNSISSETKTI